MESIPEIQPGLKIISHNSSHDTMEVINRKNASSVEPLDHSLEKITSGFDRTDPKAVNI